MSDTEKVQPIVIAPAQIIAAANQLAEKYDGSYEYDPDAWLAAVENWLRRSVVSILVDPVNAALGPRRHGPDFEVPGRCDWPGCKRSPIPHTTLCEHHTEHLAVYPTSGWGTYVIPAEDSELVIPARETHYD